MPVRHLPLFLSSGSLLLLVFVGSLLRSPDLGEDGHDNECMTFEMPLTSVRKSENVGMGRRSRRDVTGFVWVGNRQQVLADRFPSQLSGSLRIADFCKSTRLGRNYNFDRPLEKTYITW